jgi:hypothetical protein
LAESKYSVDIPFYRVYLLNSIILRVHVLKCEGDIEDFQTFLRGYKILTRGIDISGSGGIDENFDLK